MRSTFLFVNVIITTVSFSAFGQEQILNENRVDEQIIFSNLASMGLAFAENSGQWDDKIDFRAESDGIVYFFCRDEIVLLLTRDTDELINFGTPNSPDIAGISYDIDMNRYKKDRLIIKTKFVGANVNAKITGERRLGHYNNYFVGNDPARWHTDVPNYSEIIYKNIYPGIDLRYYSDGRSLKYDFIVNPGANISQIKIKYTGVEDLKVISGGDLQVQTRFGVIREKAPYIYQQAGDRRIEITGRYEFIEAGIFGFALCDSINNHLQLIIDPELAYSTYFGGSSHDVAFDIAIDPSGNVYVVGGTDSADFPTVDPFDDQGGGFDNDAFIAKFSSAGSTLLYSTYLGGDNGNDGGLGIAVDSSGNAFIVGTTSSDDLPLVNPYDDSFNGNSDVFVAKLSSTGNSLVYSSYLGGGNFDYGRDIAVDANECAYIVGFTESADFPTVNPYDGSFGGGIYDAYVTKFSNSGNSLDYSTFVGGEGMDLGMSISVNDSSNAYITGETNSRSFPTLNPYDGYFNGGSRDAFLTKLSGNGDALVYSTYLGGSDMDTGRGVALDSSGNAYMCGFTASYDFPVYNPYSDSFAGGDYDAFVTKFSNSGSHLAFSTYLGGSLRDIGNGIAIDGAGNTFVIGHTYSSDFPVVDAYDESHNGNSDVFISMFSTAGNSLIYSTYFGGEGTDAGYNIVADALGMARITGETNSLGFPTVNAWDPSLSGPNDAFLAGFEISSKINTENESPVGFLLVENYPNPFNARTIISWVLGESRYTRIDIYDLLGRKIESLVKNEMPAGRHSAVWDASDYPSGIYFFLIKAGKSTESKKMILLK